MCREWTRWSGGRGTGREWTVHPVPGRGRSRGATGPDERNERQDTPGTLWGRVAGVEPCSWTQGSRVRAHPQDGGVGGVGNPEGTRLLRAFHPSDGRGRKRRLTKGPTIDEGPVCGCPWVE